MSLRRTIHALFPYTTLFRSQRLEVEDIGDVTVVNFTDKKILDEQNIQLIGEQLFRLVDELGRRKLLLNFRNVEYLSSRSEEHTSELQSHSDLVCRLLLEKKK